MAWFKKNTDEEETPRPRNEKAMLTIRAIAAVYLFYLAYDMVRMYMEGGPDQPSIGLLIGGTAFLVLGGAFIAYITIRDYRRMKKREAEEYLASLEAAEAEEAAEEEYEEELPEVEVDDDVPETEPEEAEAEDDTSEAEPEEETEE